MWFSPLLALAAGAVGSSVVLAGRRRAGAWLSLVLVGSGAGLAAALGVLVGPGDWEWRGGVLLGGEAVHLQLDGLSALFLALVAAVGGLGACYGHGYWSDEAHPGMAGRGRAWWSALLLSMGLVLTVSNGLHFLIAWECFAVCGYFLITLDRGRREVQAAGWLYLAASHAGTLALFAFFGLLAARTGGWELGPMQQDPRLVPLFWLMLIGFGLKAGFFPLHLWLPSAHANAPSHVSAVMSGVAIKMGVYGIIRFSGWLPVPPAAGWVLLGCGAFSALAGIAFGFAQTDVKRLLAYCSVENVGIIVAGVGTALVAQSHGGAAWGRLALAGALLHVWNHGAFKSLLFFGAGGVLHATGTREMSRLGGLWRSMPWTAAVFGLGALAASGLPPLNGFVSEWLTYLALFDATSGGGATAGSTAVAVVVLATAGALTLATFVKAGGMIFLGTPRTQPAERAHESGGWMRAPMLVLGGACLILGLAPALVWPAIARATAAWRPGWDLIPAPGALVSLGWVHLVLGVLLLLGVGAVRRRIRLNGGRVAVTWDCGYAVPSSRMQYSAASFSGIVAGWFPRLLVPQAARRRPRGLMPARALQVGRIPDPVLERLVEPVARAMLRLSAASRLLQHGGLQLYVLYVLAAAVALGGVVLLGGAS